MLGCAAMSTAMLWCRRFNFTASGEAGPIAWVTGYAMRGAELEVLDRTVDDAAWSC